MNTNGSVYRLRSGGERTGFLGAEGQGVSGVKPDPRGDHGGGGAYFVFLGWRVEGEEAGWR